MTKFYTTNDADGDRITQNAGIDVHNSEAEARAALLRAYDPKEWDHASAVIEPGSFSDCWIKTFQKPRIGDPLLTPFSYRQVTIQAPGSHPGGKMYWVTPDVDVLVVADIQELEACMNTHVINGQKIHTNFDYPPIPDRQFDWSAVTDNYDEGHPVGFGQTEEEAIADLMQLLAELDEQ